MSGKLNTSGRVDQEFIPTKEGLTPRAVVRNAN